MRKHLTTITTIIRHEKDHNRLVFTARLRQRLVVIEEEIACKSPVSEQSFLMEEVGIKPDFRSPKEFRTELGQAL